MFLVIRWDMIRTAAAAVVIVLVVLALLLRRPRDMLAAVIPLAGGIIWMLGVMRLAGQQITAANVIAMPLVVGLGIDYSVYILYRLRDASVHAAVSTTSRAVLIAGCATAAAFLALCLANNRGLVGMGLAGAVGIASCLVWSMIFLPALMARRDETGEEE